LVYPTISAQFTVEMRVAAQNREKFTNLLFWGFNVIQDLRCWHFFKTRLQCLLW